MVSDGNGARTVDIHDLSVWYGKKQVLQGISLHARRGEILGIIGPANSGKTTLLKCINRTLEIIPKSRARGHVEVGGQDVGAYAAQELRRKVGMVFPLPVGLPLSIYDNVAFAPRMAGIKRKAILDVLVERCLRQAALWDEVKERLWMLGSRLSGGQQQRLTIARALSHTPQVLCLDEFSIAVDPVTTMRIEDVLVDLKKELTIVLVTNLVQQARRLADRVAFINAGKLIEFDTPEVIFGENPKDKMTFDYVRGHFG
jgi:phosphate transport system ATP-binding protein